MVHHQQQHRHNVLLLVVSAFLAAVPAALGAYCTPTSKCWPPDLAVLAWGKAMTSNRTTVIGSENPWFNTVALNMNELKSNFPAMIVSPANEADLVSTVKFAARWKIRLVARCSGHDYNDRSTGLGIILLDMTLMNDISYDNETTHMTISAGLNFKGIYKFAKSISRVVVGGQSYTVCLAGYILGGGHSNLTPLYGLGVDNVLELRMALYNGTVLTLSPSSHPDLFNAMLGSGASSYGVLISIKYLSYPAPPYMKLITAVWLSPNTTSTPSVLDYVFNLTWFDNKPNNLVAPYVIWGGPGNRFTQINWAIVAADYQKAEDYLQPLFDLPTFVQGTKKVDIYNSSYDYAVAIYGADGSTGQIWQRKFLSNVMLPLDQEVLTRAKNITILNQHLTGFKLLLVHGGESLKGTQGVTATGYRQALGELAMGNQWDDPTEDATQMQTISDMMGRLSFANASYNNEYTSFHGIYNQLPDWKTRFFDNYSSLLQVKSKYDPCNLYTVEFGVGYDLPAATCSL